MRKPKPDTHKAAAILPGSGPQPSIGPAPLLFLIAAAEGRRTSYPSLLIFPGGAFNSVCFSLCVTNSADLGTQPIVLKFWLQGYFDRGIRGKVGGGPVSRMVVFSVTYDKFSLTAMANRSKLGGNSN